MICGDILKLFRPFVQTVAVSRPWKVAPEVPNTEEAEERVEPRDTPAPHDKSSDHDDSNSHQSMLREKSTAAKSKSGSPIIEHLQNATIVMNQVRQVKAQNKITKKRKKKNRKRENAVSSELKNIIEASSAKYGGAEAFTLEDDMEEE